VFVEPTIHAEWVARAFRRSGAAFLVSLLAKPESRQSIALH